MIKITELQIEDSEIRNIQITNDLGQYNSRSCSFHSKSSDTDLILPMFTINSEGEGECLSAKQYSENPESSVKPTFSSLKSLVFDSIRAAINSVDTDIYTYICYARNSNHVGIVCSEEMLYLSYKER